MTETLDEFIPEHILLTPCPNCGKVVTEYDAYMSCYDSYDQFEDADDPSSGCLESYWTVQCPWCQKAIDFSILEYPQKFNIIKVRPPPTGGLFSVPKKGGLFSVPASGGTGGGLFALPQQGGLFSMPESNLPALPKKGLFSLNRRGK